MTNSIQDRTILQAMEALHQRFYALFDQDSPALPLITYDEEWLSPCLIEEENSPSKVNWKPVLHNVSSVFDEIQAALEVSFHPDVIQFYTLFWSDGFWGHVDGNELSLIQVWNEDDLNMLKENILGHVFARKKNKVPLSLFIGCTDNDLIISVDNETGQVVLENPGNKHHHVLAASLVGFLDVFEPSEKPYSC